MKKKEEFTPKMVTLSIDPKFYSTLMEFCKTMGFTLVSTEMTVPNLRIQDWDDILDVVGERINPSLSFGNNKRLDDLVTRNLGRTFLEDLTKVSLPGAIGVTLRIIHECNEPEKDKKMVKKWLDNFVMTSEWWDNILKDKFLPLLYAEGYQKEGQEEVQE